MKTKKRRFKKNIRSSKNKKTFLYNPDNPKMSFDVYIDKDPSDTIPIKYTTVEDVKNGGDRSPLGYEPISRSCVGT